MADGENQGWLDDETDPFEDPTHEPVEEKTSDAPSEEEVETTPTNERLDEEIISEEETKKPSAGPDSTPSWGLPIRAAPVLAERGEQVTEYPLKQSLDGRQTTSIVVDEDLLRVVDTELGNDGHRRMKVRMTVKREITGFTHEHNELMHQHQMLWIGCFFSGLALTALSSGAIGVLGALLVIIGVRSWVMMHLETHTIEFVNEGGPQRLALHAYGSNRGFYRASMAMIGPCMADFIRTGTMDVDELKRLHTTVLAPPQPRPVAVQAMPIVVQPLKEQEATQQPMPPMPMTVPTPPQVGPPATQNTPVQPSTPIQPPPQTIPASTPTPPAPMGPPVPAPVGPPVPAPPTNMALPPAPLPPPMPPPLSGGLPPMPLPLDAPLPDAPKIAVEASPIEETLSPDEQNELLSELS